EVELADSGEDDYGELLVRGAAVTPGYYNRPVETAAAFEEGWFHTGDLATLESGRLRIAGRAKELVHVGGFNVFPAEVEGVLLAHPDIAQAVVLGVPHPAMGEVLQAFVVPREDAKPTSAALLRFARERIAGYKLPYAIEIRSELPAVAPHGRAALRDRCRRCADVGARARPRCLRTADGATPVHPREPDAHPQRTAPRDNGAGRGASDPRRGGGARCGRRERRRARAR